ncbi:hypothetical protein Aab01nite_83950 [Paractinoplanes abujensis]|uniref:Sulfur carrier protein n=1 Tax=Paractinoplanes abujensis TaxID=882441 RepID=A0A7W7CXY0_9ACTN|nr:sulfur carrier protein ThiS [Actinoplanes abujensis]MBB4695328.1 sulfur carrier protein [Actinoplanes abujensis]GID24805.1 hypothetical protein Aab01nite_83950 [Actinoplanes abujensis]
MKLTVNGNVVESDAATVQALVEAITEARRGVAVAVNGEVVPRSTWGLTGLAAGDVVEVLTAAQGG